MLAMSAAVLAAALLQQAPTVGLAVQPPVGLTDAEAASAQKALAAELTSLGLVVVSAPAVDAACVPDPACVEAARSAAAAPLRALLVVELVRVGPVLQLTATGTAGADRVLGSHGLDEAQFKQGPLLPQEVRAWAEQLPPPAPTAPPPPSPEPGLELSPLKIGAVGAASVGGLAVLVGAVLLATSEPVLGDKTSSGAEKEQAVALGWTGLAAGAIGVVAIGAGVALFVLE